jgi:hypothetical protein
VCTEVGAWIKLNRTRSDSPSTHKSYMTNEGTQQDGYLAAACRKRIAQAILRADMSLELIITKEISNKSKSKILWRRR